jgi:hypothetical protein
MSKLNSNHFKAFYDSLPANKQPDFRDQVCNICGFSIPTFYRRLNDWESLFTELEKNAIAKMAEASTQTIFGLTLKTV